MVAVKPSALVAARSKRQAPMGGGVPVRAIGPEPLGRTPAEADLARAFAMADRGELGAASRICELHLATNGASAEAYCLLGIVKQAAADLLSAMECFDKALYLEPEYYDALVHLALLHEKRGDGARAEHLRRRAERELALRSAR